MKTHFLNLTKPIPGAVNWGTAMNQNWDMVDRSYGQLQQNINALTQKMTDLGTFTYIKAIKDNTVVDINYMVIVSGYLQIKNATGDYWYTFTCLDDSGQYTDSVRVTQRDKPTLDMQGAAIFGSLKQDAGSETQSFEQATIEPYDRIYYVDADEAHTQFATISDYTAFQLYTPQLDNLELQSGDSVIWHAFGETWYGNEIAIKTSVIQNNTRQTLIRKFQQGLGGYYTPRISNSKPNTIVWDKVAGSSADVQYEITIPHNLWEGVYNEHAITGTKHTTNLPQESSVSDITYEHSISDVCFWLKKNNQTTRIYVDYWITVNDQSNFQISWSSTLPNDAYISYIYTRYVKEGA